MANSKQETIVVCITKRCFSHCAYCYDRIATNEKDINCRTFSGILDKCSVIGIRHITLTGGEPTLHPDFSNLLKLALKRELLVLVLSNGNTGWHPDSVDPRYYASGQLSFNLSRDYPDFLHFVVRRAAPEVTDVFAARLIELGSKPVMRAVVTSGSACPSKLDTHLVKMEAMGVRHVRLQPVILSAEQPCDVRLALRPQDAEFFEWLSQPSVQASRPVLSGSTKYFKTIARIFRGEVLKPPNPCPCGWPYVNAAALFKSCVSKPDSCLVPFESLGHAPPCPRLAYGLDCAGYEII